MIDATRASIFTMLEPSTAVILGFLIFQEMLSYESLMGFAMILTSVLLISMSKS